jgi:hypothetical protein
MIDETVSVIVFVIVGIAGGFLSSWMAWNASGETFDRRKHGNALITGAIVGLGLGIAAAVVDVSTMAMNQWLLLVFTTFGTAVGLDRVRSSTSGAVAERSTTKTTGSGAVS